jgi:hypothetical protein
VAWNIVPSYLGDDNAIRVAKTSDLAAARPSIGNLVDLLPDLRVVLLLGKSAQRGWAHLGLALATVAAPHPRRRTSTRVPKPAANWEMRFNRPANSPERRPADVGHRRD